jgi:hypothetical protein
MSSAPRRMHPYVVKPDAAAGALVPSMPMGRLSPIQTGFNSLRRTRKGPSGVGQPGCPTAIGRFRATPSPAMKNSWRWAMLTTSPCSTPAGTITRASMVSFMPVFSNEWTQQVFRRARRSGSLPMLWAIVSNVSPGETT